MKRTDDDVCFSNVFDLSFIAKALGKTPARLLSLDGRRLGVIHVCFSIENPNGKSLGKKKSLERSRQRREVEDAHQRVKHCEGAARVRMAKGADVSGVVRQESRSVRF